MKPVKNITVIGDGGWGTTLAVLLAKKGFGVTIWGIFPDYVEILKSDRENIKFLPGVKIPPQVKITSDISEAVAKADLIVLPRDARGGAA